MKKDDAIFIQDVSLSLLAEGIPVKIKLGGSSMLPFLHAGDFATVIPATTEELQPGDIVVFSISSKVIAHRVTMKSQQNDKILIFTKGDSLKKPDPPLPASMILGKIISFEHKGKQHDLCSPRWMKRNYFMARYSRWFRPVYYLYFLFRRIRSLV